VTTFYTYSQPTPEKLAKGQQTLIDELAQHFERLGRQMAAALQESASDLRSFVVARQGASESLRDLQEGFSGLVSGVIQSNGCRKNCCG
jgi:hypothetical protein